MILVKKTCFWGARLLVKTIWGRWVGGKGFSPAGPPKNGIGLCDSKIASPITRIAPSYGPILPLIIGLSTQKGGTPGRVPDRRRCLDCSPGVCYDRGTVAAPAFCLGIF